MIQYYSRIEQIAQKSDLRVLKLETTADPNTVPSDVFDLASLALSEIRYFSTLVGVDVKFALFIPEEKLPSDVYQSVGQLEARLAVLETLVDDYPNWHSMEH